jgi:hypothetical protein
MLLCLLPISLFTDLSFFSDHETFYGHRPVFGFLAVTLYLISVIMCLALNILSTKKTLHRYAKEYKKIDTNKLVSPLMFLSSFHIAVTNLLSVYLLPIDTPWHYFDFISLLSQQHLIQLKSGINSLARSIYGGVVNTVQLQEGVNPCCLMFCRGEHIVRKKRSY